jgi:uncharacterized membrane protein
MATRKEIKKAAREQLGNAIFSDKWLMMLLILFVYSLINSLCAGANYGYYGGVTFMDGILSLTGAVIWVIVGGPLLYSIARITTKAARTGDKVDFKDLTIGFNESMSDAIFLNFMRALFTALWTLLFIIPGFIKMYSYSMAMYIQQDQDNKDWNFCIKKSMEMMKGHKWELFVLDLSFIGWYLVGLLCLGIGVLWVNPYHQMARANFYLELVKLNGGEAKDAEGEVIDGETEEFTDVDEKVFKE